VSGFNLLAARSLFKVQPLRLRIGAEDAGEHGAVCLEITVPCEPCSKMETLLVPCGYNAMRDHGGVTASVMRGGWLRVGDAVRVLPG
jgi:MOSC domain-containing protein YiiM